MTAQENRVHAMVRAGNISEDEGARLLAALKARRREIAGWKVLFKPMDVLSTRAVWAAAAVVTAASIAVGRLGIRFDGALDLHRVAGTPAWSVVLFDAANAIVLTGAVLWVVSLAVAKRVRLIDFVMSVALARAAYVAGAVVLYLVIPNPEELEAAVVAAITNNTPIDLWLVLRTVLVMPFIAWFIALLYQGFRTSSGVDGAKAGVAFTLGILAAEVLSKLALVAAAAGLVTTVLYAQSPVSVAGAWSGAIETPAGGLRIVVRLQQESDASWSGTIDIPQQRAKGVRLVDVVVDRPSVSFRIPGAPGDPTIRVTVSDDGSRMTGTLVQGGGTVPVNLTRGEAAAETAAPKRPQTPALPVPYIEEEVTFRNEAADVQLAGTLTLPRSGGPFPAVVLISGSGPQDRDSTLFDHKPFLVWADHLTRQGVAVLRVDDRGTGQSSRGPATVTSSDLTEDVRAGVAFLQKRPDVKQIGLIGHSEGAMLAAMVAASSPDVAFIVMLAGPGLPGDQILSSQAALMFKASGASDAAIAWDGSVRERVFALVKAETDGRPNEAMRRKLLDELASAEAIGPGAPDGAAARSLAETLLTAVSAPWLRFYLAYDPREALMKVRCPVLAVTGDRDVQVEARANLPEIERAVRAGGNTDVTVAALPGLNHLLQTSTTGMPNEYGTIEETVAPAVLKLVTDWIQKRTG